MMPWFQGQITKWSRPNTYAGLLMSTPELRRAAFKHSLIADTADGRGLRDAALVPGQHSWLDEGHCLLSGAKFAAALGVRLGTLPTRGRSARGRPVPGWCDCCGSPTVENLYHVLQTCPRTHRPRIDRHNRIQSVVSDVFTRKGYKVMGEPHFMTKQGLRKPDLLVYKEDKTHSIVLDVAVSADNLPDPDTRHWDKVRYYSQYEEISLAVEGIAGIRPEYSSVTLNWRGLFSPASAADLQRWGFTQRDIGLIAAITVEQGAVIHRIFNTSTHVTHRALGLRQ